MTPKDIKDWRGKVGYTQTDLADALGLSRQAVAHWEGRVRPVPPWLHLALVWIEMGEK